MSFKICKQHESFGSSGGLVIWSGLGKANMKEPKKEKIPSEFKHLQLHGPIAPILPRPYFSAHVLIRLKSRLAYRNASPRTPISTSSVEAESRNETFSPRTSARAGLERFIAKVWPHS